MQEADFDSSDSNGSSDEETYAIKPKFKKRHKKKNF